MATVQHIYCCTTSAHRTHANATLLIIVLLDKRALMFPFCLYWKTTITVFAMKILVLTANSTKSTFVTMVIILLFEIIIIKVANGAEVAGKIDFAIQTRLPRFLDLAAFVTHNLSNRKCVHHMPFLHIFLIKLLGIILIWVCIQFMGIELNVIMTKPTAEELQTFGTP